MRVYWCEIASRYQADNEMDLYDQLYAAEKLNEEKLKTIEANSAYWRSRAEAEYDQNTLFFRNLEYRDDQGKHLARPKESRGELLERSRRRGNAIFFSEVDLEILTKYAFFCVGFNWRRMINDRPPHFYLQTQGDTGASQGEYTNCLRLDFDYSTFRVHGHPILHKEKPADQIWLEECPETFHEDEDAMSKYDIDEEWIYYRKDVAVPEHWEL